MKIPTYFRLMIMILCLLGCLLGARTAAGQDRSAKGPASTRLSPDEQEQFLKRIEGNFSTIRSLWTEFLQEKHLEIFTEVIKAKGRCIFQSPDRVRFEFTEPFKSVMIVKDGKVSKYEFLEGKWQKLETGQQQIILMVLDHVTSWIRGRFAEKKAVYEIAVEKGDHTRIIMSPKDAKFREHIRSIELVLTKEEKGLKQIIIREPGGDYTLITFTNEKRNIDIPEAVFNGLGPEPRPSDF
jgi:outer membrane lipoprotein carrier protein